MRLTWIDAAKGWGIVLIVIGHIYSVAEPGDFYKILYAFHVPLFFFISGLTLKPDAAPWHQILQKKANTLLVPYLYYAFLGYLFYLAGYFAAQKMGFQIEQFQYGLWTPLYGIFYGTLGDGHLVNTPVWFLLALFITYMLGHTINSRVRRADGRLFLVLALTLAGLLVGDRVKLPWSLSAALISLVFLQAGFYFQSIDLTARLGLKTLRLLAFALFAVLLLSPVNDFVALSVGTVGHPVGFLFFAFTGIFATLFLVLGFPGLSRPLAWVGRYSLPILVIHMLIIKSVKVLLVFLLGTTVQAIETGLGLGLLVMLVTAVLLVPVVYVMQRWLAFSLGQAVAAHAGGSRIDMKGVQ